MAAETEDYFAIDIGSTGLRAVQLRRGGGKPVLSSFGDVQLPLGMGTSDSQIDQDKVAQTIQQLMRDTRITTTNVVAGIPASQAFATVVTTPKLTEEELGKAMKLQADQYIPMAVDQVKMDWQVIGQGPKENEMQVLLVAAPNTVVTKYFTLLEKAGLNIVAMEINPVALYRSLMGQGGVSALIIDIGSLATDIVLVHNNAPQLVRSVPVGGNTFVKAVGQALGLDDVQADQFTRKFGLTQTKLEGQVLKAVKTSLDGLVSEAEKSVKFFTTQNDGVKLEKLILTGGTAAMPELPTYLANAMGLPVELGNPWAGVSYPANLQDTLTGKALEYSVAVGLAQRAFV